MEDEVYYRTEEIKSEDVLKIFVETSEDRAIVDALKAIRPVILVGSRGMGKSLLLRVAEEELKASFNKYKVVPVYVTFRKSSLIQTTDSDQFQHWMLARICREIIRSLKKFGLISTSIPSLTILSGDTMNNTITSEKFAIEELVDLYENSWQNPGQAVTTSKLPTVDQFIEAIEEICLDIGLKRIVLFIDEAAHILIQEQQRQFFTLFRDLRSPYLSCNAAVYPGVTSYGNTFQSTHDSVTLYIERDVLSEDYVNNMRKIVESQASSELMVNIAKRGENFAILSYAAHGNPRILLKTLGQAPKLDSNQINQLIKEYYRTTVWSEHSTLSEKYEGYRVLIDWGRRFIEEKVLPDLQGKNTQYLAEGKNTTCFFWIHKEAPEFVKRALQILAYSGIVREHATGIVATRGNVGTRYSVNLGCLFALEPIPSNTAFLIAKKLTPKRMVEFGADHSYYATLEKDMRKFTKDNNLETLNQQLTKSIDVLDLPYWLIQKLKGININTVGDILTSSENKLKEAYYVGNKRARRTKNAAEAAVHEYLAG